MIKNMEKNIYRIIILILLLLSGFLYITGARTSKELAQLKINYNMLDSIRNELGQTVLVQKTTLIQGDQERQLLKRQSDSAFNLTKKQAKRIKDILAYYTSTATTKIDTTFVPYEDTNSRKQWEAEVVARCSKVIDYYEANSIFVPKTARDTTQYYTADFTASLTGIRINQLSISDSQYIRFVTIKGGFLKKDTYGKRHLFLRKSIETQVLHTNPLIHVGTQTSAIYLPPKKPHIVGKAILVGIGIFLGKKL